MNEDQLRTLTQNRDWFNEFFSGLQQIYDRARTMLEVAFPLSVHGLYYPKPNFVPSIPKYYLFGMGGDQGAIQIFTVMDPEMFSHPFFRREPSIVVIAHADGMKYLHVGDYAERILGHGPIADEVQHDEILSGSIRGQTAFHAFQLGFEHFEEGRDLDQEIRVSIIDRLKPLFPFPIEESQEPRG